MNGKEREFALLLMAVGIISSLAPDLPTVVGWAKEQPELLEVTTGVYVLLAFLVLYVVLK